MKKTLFRFKVLLIAVFILSCTKDNLIEQDTVFSESSSIYNVTMSDIQKYVKAKTIGTKTDSNCDIKVLKIESDTLAYFLNYIDGFEIIVGDKRLEPILVKGDTKYCIDSLNPNEQFWLESELDYIHDFKNSPQTKGVSEINLFWSQLDGPVNNTKVEGDPTEDNKYWELIEIQDDSRSYEETSGHLIKTVWNQHHPWNQCVPYNSTGSDKCPSGCVAVAGAQMLHYLHEKLGKPNSFFTNGQCVGNVNSYTFSFIDSDTSAFSNMALNYLGDEESKYKASLLIGWIGCEVNMEYGNENSSANIKDLKADVFNGIGINCKYTENFNRNIIWGEVANDHPVLIGGFRTKKTILGFPKYSGGHAWIVDGYVLVHNVQRYIYEWKSKTQNELYEYGERREEFVTTDYEFVLMNWGWGNYQCNTQYSLMGDWTYDGRNYKYSRCMVYDFS